MSITHAEGRLRTLLMIWLILFAGGVIVMGGAAWYPAGSQLYTKNPLLALTWVGQTLLLLCSCYLFSGIRDNELSAPVIAWYKLVSGTAMLIFLMSRGSSSGSMLPLLAGALLDYVMGGLTFVFWLMARRSRVLRMPLVFDIDPSIEEEPTGSAARALRFGLAISAVIFAVTSLALLVAVLFFLTPQNAVFKLAAGNAVAVYAALGFLSSLSAESPWRRAYAHDIVMGGFIICSPCLYFLDNEIPVDFNCPAFISGWCGRSFCYFGNHPYPKSDSCSRSTTNAVLWTLAVPGV